MRRLQPKPVEVAFFAQEVAALVDVHIVFATQRQIQVVRRPQTAPPRHICVRHILHHVRE